MLFRSCAMTNSTGADSDDGDGLARIDAARQHHAVDRRVDDAVVEVDLVELEVGLGDRQLGIGAVDGDLGAVARGLGGYRGPGPRPGRAWPARRSAGSSARPGRAWPGRSRHRPGRPATEALELSTWADSLAVSSVASTSPLATCWFSSTSTERTTPDSWLETSTVVSGCRLPVAVTSTVRSPRLTGVVCVGDLGLAAAHEGIAERASATSTSSTDSA